MKSNPAVENLKNSEVLAFASAKAWEKWLEKNFASSRGVWLRLARKNSIRKSVGFSEALDIALCHGWITGQARGETKETWLSRFLPRKESSIWSRINREKALALIASGRMRPAGLEAIERAKRNGQWARAYDSPRRAAVPPDLKAALDANPRARSFFAGLDSANRYAILFRLQTSKQPETRAKKIRRFVEMLDHHRTFHSARKAAKKLPA